MKILVPVDDSPAALSAARQAGQRLREHGPAEVVLLHVLDLPPALLEHGGAPDAEAEDRIERDMEQARQAWLERRRGELGPTVFAPAREAVLEGAGEGGELTVQTRVAANPPEGRLVSAILDEIADGRYDAVALGAHIRSRHAEATVEHLADEIRAEHPECAIWLDR